MAVNATDMIALVDMKADGSTTAHPTNESWDIPRANRVRPPPSSRSIPTIVFAYLKLRGRRATAARRRDSGILNPPQRRCVGEPRVGGEHDPQHFG
jgi:hypothetical protein